MPLAHSDKFLLFFVLGLITLACAPIVSAIDRAPTYDYNNGKFNLTNVNTPVYNVINRSYDFGPAGNQYSTLANNLSSTEFPLNTTPRSLLAWINLNSENAAGQAYALATMGYNFSAGMGTEFKIEFNNTQCLRGQIIQNGSFNTGTFGCGYANKTWVPVMEVYNGSSCIVFINSSANVSLNTTCQGAYLASGVNATLPDRLFGEGVGGGGANGMWNGTMKYVQLYNRSVSGAEFDNYIRNNTINSSGLIYSFSFENTTSTNITVNLSQLLNAGTPTIGVHSGTSPLSSPMWCYNNTYIVCDYAEAQSYFKQSNIPISDSWRKSIDFSNVVASYSGVTGNATWNVITGSGQNFKNINIARSLVSWANNTSTYVVFNIDDIPTQLADNDSECNYGVSSTGPTLSAAENQATCDPTSYTIFNHLVAQFLVDVGCYNYTSGVCALEGYNEYYLRQFYNTNATAVPDNGVCTTRVQKVLNYWNQSGRSQWRAELTTMGFNPDTIRWYGSPAFTNESSTCGNALGNAWSANFTKGSTKGADYLIEHTYTSQCSPPGSNGLTSSDDANQATANLGGYNNTWGVTEGNIICNALNNNTNNNSQYASYLAQDWLYNVKNNNRSFNTIFKDSSINLANNESQFYIAFRGSALTTTGNVFLSGPYYFLNATKYFQPGLPLYNCTSSSTSSADCVYEKVNSTNGILLIVSKLNNQLDIDNVSISGFNISVANRLLTNVNETVVGGKTDLSFFQIYDLQVFNITSNATQISATFTPSTYIVNITENASQTFSVASITNPDSQTYNIVWKNSTGGSSVLHCANQTTCTQIGNFTSAGQYNWSVDVVGETNTVSKVWLLQINNTNQNISAVYSPASPLTITEGASQAFTYTITNLDSQANNTTWYVGGVIQTAYYNNSTFTVSTNTSSAGTYNISVLISSATNNLTNDWILTVVDAVAPSCNASANLGAGLSLLPQSFSIGSYIIILLLLIGSVYAFYQGFIDVKTLLVLCLGLAMFIVVAMLFIGASAGTVNSLSTLGC